MSAGAPEKIVIRAEELADPSVDDALARQLSFGMAGAPEKVPDKKTGLIYRAWFSLMIAGGLGALLGWGIIEPFFDDGVVLQGAVQNVATSDVAAEGWRGTIQVDGRTIWLHEDETEVRRDGREVGVEGLAMGQVLDVRGQIVSPETGTGMIASEIEILGEAGEVAPLSAGTINVRRSLIGLAIFPLLAGLIGLFIGAADGLLSRASRRAGTCGLVGLGMGLAIGTVATLLAALVYGFGRMLVESLDGPEPGLSAAALIAQMIIRGIAWAIAGAAMGLGQGIALRSKKMLVNGLLGGIVGALIGGLLFDPIDLLLGGADGGAEASRAIGFLIIGMSTGLMIGLVELLAREAWVKMLTGPLAGKEMVLYKDPTTIGSSPKADIYLFKDPEVEPSHAFIRALGEGYELEDAKSPAGVFVNGRRVTRCRLETGDQIRIGKTVFSFSIKES